MSYGELLPPSDEEPSAARRWYRLLIVTVLCLAVGGVFAAAGRRAGRGYGVTPPNPPVSVVLWIVAGLLIALPLAAVPWLRFRASRSLMWQLYGGAALAVAVGGFFVTILT